MMILRAMFPTFPHARTPRAVESAHGSIRLLKSRISRTISEGKEEMPKRVLPSFSRKSDGFTYPGLGGYGRFDEDWQMTRMTPFSSPLLLGFDTMEKTLERIAKSGDGYPPYNIERLRTQSGPERLRITLAVAGFSDSDLEVTTEDNQLVIRGRQTDEEEREFLHRGIAARQFQRVFVLADGMRVIAAQLKNGLLSIDLDRPEPERLVKRIDITVKD
jgi:HSP20 family molecular chaperone IbpA